ncbi:MAG: hypothetical protein AAF639_05795 [Chloroflexota bacterium]
MTTSIQLDQKNQSWLPPKGTILFTLCAMLMTVGLTLGTGFCALSTGIINVGAASLNQPATHAPSTSIIPYQGRLADADGNPLSATVDMRFRLYDTAEGGTPLWAEAWTDANGVQVTDGMFNVMLGSMTPISATVMNENSSLFLGLAAGDDDEMTPRVQLGSVPFAMQGWRVPDGSITSEKLDLKSGTACLSDHETYDFPGGSYIFKEIPSLSLDFSLEKPSKVLIWMDGLARSTSSTGESGVTLKVDGANQVSTIFQRKAGWWFNVNGQRILQLSTGHHSLQGATYSNTTSSMIIHGIGSFKTCINYLVLGEQ